MRGCFGTPVGALLGVPAIGAGQRFARRWENRHSTRGYVPGGADQLGRADSEVGHEGLHGFQDVDRGGFTPRNLAESRAHSADEQVGNCLRRGLGL